jgi:hypothetical protein
MRRFYVLVLLVGLMGCDGNGRNKPAAAQSLPVPATIEKMMATAFPADGKIHVQSKGQFVVNIDTQFCTYPNSFSVGEAWYGLFEKLNIPKSNSQGSGRANGPVEGCISSLPANTIRQKGTQFPNRNGKPYKLVLAVWQGDVAAGTGAYWVGGVERTEGLDNLNPHAKNNRIVIGLGDNIRLDGTRRPPPTAEYIYQVRVGTSMNADQRELSQEFIQFISIKE